MITRKTKIILYDTEAERYKIGTLAERNNNQVPVCTVSHFFDTVCDLFEDVTPKIGSNPMYQKIDWSEIENNGIPEAADAKN